MERPSAIQLKECDPTESNFCTMDSGPRRFSEENGGGHTNYSERSPRRDRSPHQRDRSPRQQDRSPRRRSRSRERESRRDDRPDKRSQHYSGAVGLRTLTGTERMDYYTKRLGGASLGEVETQERSGLGFASATENIKNVVEATPADPLAEIMRRRQAHAATILQGTSEKKAEIVPLAAVEPDDERTVFTKQMTQAMNDGNVREAGRLKKQMEDMVPKQAKKKGSFMSRQLQKIKRVQQVNAQQRQEEEQLEQMDGPRGEFIRFQREVEKVAATGSGQR